MRADASLAQNPTRVDPLQGANAQLATAAVACAVKAKASPKPETTALKSRARAERCQQQRRPGFPPFAAYCTSFAGLRLAGDGMVSQS